MPKKEPSLCDEKIFSDFFKQHYKSLVRYIYYKCGDLEHAEDIVQNVFVKIWKRCEKLIYSTAKSYLYTACNNLFLNQVAHKKVILKYRKTIKENTDHETPVFLMEQEEFRTKLMAAINDLNYKEREVFLLSRVEGKTYKEIAEMTGLTVKAIERRMSKALKVLRKKSGHHIKKQ